MSVRHKPIWNSEKKHLLNSETLIGTLTADWWETHGSRDITSDSTISIHFRLDLPNNFYIRNVLVNLVQVQIGRFSSRAYCVKIWLKFEMGYGINTKRLWIWIRIHHTSLLNPIQTWRGRFNWAHIWSDLVHIRNERLTIHAVFEKITFTFD